MYTPEGGCVQCCLVFSAGIASRILAQILASFARSPGRSIRAYVCIAVRSTGQLAEEVGLVHVVLERLVAIDEDYGDFVGELAA
jgi:hypothetical protein